MLAMQDLTLATDEIRRVAGLRTQLETMEEYARQMGEGGASTSVCYNNIDDCISLTLLPLFLPSLSHHRERVNTLDKLSSLEDESAAVKVSLIQLLQEKSATNKTLALENWRLRQTVCRHDNHSLSLTNTALSLILCIYCTYYVCSYRFMHTYMYVYVWGYSLCV